ncbi:PaaI family thioesterase [Blastococcus sp. MG754426]|uniref:PaaI family thioesterase n=1 Tax=unclassified Blastococcus TaxID=2619396 RepID=UPI001EEFD160|nr:MULTISPECIES: PaaI family thioesterase [unclassified Blastococcus]MCF6506903.1 PaaI family thioesterase [Blastococcus sp. MG754426]MCF6511851.1 PaaI family thioesterase [Blastococcus sp. MG754427]MCF6736794.1 PaaI family thioesterase [Blastococcus sp. KM273129]
MAEDREVRRAAVGELGEALRDLVDAAVRTEVPLDRLAEATSAARELTALLSTDLREVHEIASVDDPDSGQRWYSPVYGPGSPVAPPMVVDDFPDEGRCVGRVTVGKKLEGPPGLVHGGVVATLLDHVLARSARGAGHGGLTATLTVTYRRPVHLGVPLLVTGQLVSVEGRRATATARLVAEDDPGTTLAEGEALLVALRAERASEVFARTGRDVGAWTSRS